MSVVNKMLRDLENRKHRPQVSANYIPPNKTKHIWLSGSVLATLCVIASTYFLFPEHAEREQTIQQAPADAITLEKGDQIAQVPNTENTVLAQTSLTSPARELTSSAVVNNIAQTLATASATASATTMDSKDKLGQFNQNISQQNSEQSADTHKTIDSQKTATDTEFTITASDGSKSKLSKLRSLAHLASQRGDDDEVISIMQQILQHDPKALRIRKQLAALLFSKSRLTEAQSILVQGLQQTPADSSLRLMLSRIHFKTGQHEQALTILTQHPYNALANDELLSFRAALAEKIGNYPLAQQDYQLLVQRNPLQAKWWLGLGVAQDKQKLRQEAIGSYQQAQQLKQLPAQVETFVEQRISLLARRS